MSITQEDKDRIEEIRTTQLEVEKAINENEKINHTELKRKLDVYEKEAREIIEAQIKDPEVKAAIMNMHYKDDLISGKFINEVEISAKAKHLQEVVKEVSLKTEQYRKLHNSWIMRGSNFKILTFLVVIICYAIYSVFFSA
jgi:glycyl-tRNA synthetase alpha subunit